MFVKETPKKNDSASPLADKMRPATIEEFVGQRHLIGEGKILRKMIESDSFGSIIIWGPPGSGKTTLAKIVSIQTNRIFEKVSAVTSGVADLRKVIERATKNVAKGERTILFIDEIHRFNKAQQDVILPHVENGDITLIGATTENPSFEVISALRSRCRIYHLEPLPPEGIKSILNRAIEDKEKGLGNLNPQVDEEAIEHIIRSSEGDARFMLNTLEDAVATTEPDENNIRRITLAAIEEVLQRRAAKYDKMGGEHFDHASAFQKSMRGSDPDATLYWLAKMISGGEDPRFIARRMIITAAEDVGNADPLALLLATSAAETVAKIGWPEARIPLAQAATYIAIAPKSNTSVKGIDKALNDIEKNGKSFPVPNHLKPASYKDAKGYGFGGYKYPHDHKNHYLKQDYLPQELKGTKYYEPSDQGREATMAKRLKKIKEENK